MIVRGRSLNNLVLLNPSQRMPLSNEECHFSSVFFKLCPLLIFQCHPVIYSCVSRVLFFLKDCSLQFCVHFSSLYVVCALSASALYSLSLWWCFLNSTICEACVYCLFHSPFNSIPFFSNTVNQLSFVGVKVQIFTRTSWLNYCFMLYYQFYFLTQQTRTFQTELQLTVPKYNLPLTSSLNKF